MKHRESDKPDRWLTAAEVGERLSCSEDCVWKAEGALAELTRIPLSKGAVRYSENELLEWMATQFQKAKSQSNQPNNVVNIRRKPKLTRERGKQILNLLRSGSNDGSND